jgi:hypothetical protein
LDRGRTLHRIAKTLVAVSKRDAEALRQEAQKHLADMGPIEDFCGYPGPRPIAQRLEAEIPAYVRNNPIKLFMKGRLLWKPFLDF